MEQTAGHVVKSEGRKEGGKDKWKEEEEEYRYGWFGFTPAWMQVRVEGGGRSVVPSGGTRSPQEFGEGTDRERVHTANESQKAAGQKPVWLCVV